MKRRALALCAALCLTLGACGRGPAPAEPPAGGVSSAAPAAPAVSFGPFTLPVEPGQGWDPYVGSGSGNMVLLGLTCESLFALDNTFTPQPVLATKGEASEDGLSWTVRLRSGVSFSNGEALTAKRAADAVTAAMGGKSLYAGRLANVKKVTAPDENTLVFQLSAPNANFLAILDFPVALVDKEGVYGTGPYAVGEGELVLRQDWWQKKAMPLSVIPLKEESGADDLIADFNAGEISLVAADPTGLDALGWSGTRQSWEYPTATMLYLGFRCTGGPCRSAAFRQAVSRALDRNALAGRALSGHAVAAVLPVPPSSPRYDKALAATVGYDPLAAGEALEELGYKRKDDGLLYSGKQPLALTVLVNSDNVYKERLAQAVADSLSALGIQATVRPLPWEEYKKALEKGDFDLYLAESRLAGDLDPGAFLTAGSGLYFGGFQSRELTEALAGARQSGEWGEFYALWLREAPLAPLCFKNGAVLTRWGQVDGAVPTQGNVFNGFENWTIS